MTAGTRPAASSGRLATLAAILDRWLPSLVTVFLFYTPFLAALGVERNRYFLFWGRRDTLAVFLSIALLSGLAALLGLAIDRSGNRLLAQLRDLVFLTFLGLGALANLLPLLHIEALLDFARSHRGMAGLLLDLGSGLIAVGWVIGVWLRREQMIRFARAATLILSPLVILLLGPALIWRSWDYPRDPIPASSGEGEDGTPIYFFVFDEWSYDRMMKDGDILPDLPHLRALKSQSLFFTAARSPAASTHVSLPRILFQSRDDESLPYVFIDRREPKEPRGPAPEHITDDQATGAQPESLMALARRNRYTTYLVGFYLPYPHIIGNEADVDRAYSDYPKGDGILDRMLITTLGAPQYWFMPGISSVWKGVWAHIFSRHWLRLNEDVKDDFDAIVNTAPRRSLVFIHFPAPHAPFVFNPDGTYHGPFPVNSGGTADIDADIMAGSPEDYHRHLLYLDHIVGGFMERLRQAGDFDRSLLVLTADHAWRVDPAITPEQAHDAKRHVPLMIKLPGQTTPEVLDTDIALDELRPLIDRTVRGSLGPEPVKALFTAQAPAPQPVPTTTR
ncbi:MAG TPA: sulfatase-like hydrolase/transferase [Candidatus Polarisedimenticolia bacterium]|nr:sulfatase-like hydrolase/transferase [Candidatus Polarisedimenticolia bacterium]